LANFGPFSPSRLSGLREVVRQPHNPAQRTHTSLSFQLPASSFQLPAFSFRHSAFGRRAG
jgi:hypothetical protein